MLDCSTKRITGERSSPSPLAATRGKRRTALIPIATTQIEVTS